MFDAKLPHLEKILDPELVLHKFNNAFGSKFFKKNMFPESCTIERIQHKKGKRCRVLYRLRMSNGNGINSDQWFYGKLVKPGQAANQFRLALASEYLANGEWPAVSHWEDWDFILWAFPNDPDMPGLRIAADPDYVRSVLNENIHKFGYDLDWRCENIIVDRVKYMPGKRCVLRMNAELSKGSSERRKLTFFSKTYPDRNSLMHYRILNEIHQQFDDIINIPRPILYLDEAKSFWQENWPGRPLIDMLQYANWDALFRHLGELVAQFHTKNVQGLSRKADFITVINDAHEDAKMMGWLLPELRLRMDRILETLIETQDSLQTHYIPTVPIHGALRLEQFIARNNDVALLDFDAVSAGDPLLDAAEFIASLQYMEFTHSLSRQKIARAVECFRESYFQLVPWEHNKKRMAWYAVAFLLTKMYDSVKNIDQKAIGEMNKALEVQKHWLNMLKTDRTNHFSRTALREFA